MTPFTVRTSEKVFSQAHSKQNRAAVGEGKGESKHGVDN